jgi:hypothetical protein
MTSFFTDQFQISDGQKYPFLYPSQTFNAVQEILDNFLRTENPLVKGWAPADPGLSTGKGKISGGNWTPQGVAREGAYWAVPFNNPCIVATVEREAVIGSLYAFWVSTENTAKGTSGYVVAIEITAAAEAVVDIFRFDNGKATLLLSLNKVKISGADIWSFQNEEGELSVNRNGETVMFVFDYTYGFGQVGFEAAGNATIKIKNVRGGELNSFSGGTAQAVRQEVRYSEGPAYEKPPCFVSYKTITPAIGTLLQLEELRVELFGAGGGQPATILEKELQKFGNELTATIGAVNAVILLDPAQFLIGGSTDPYQYKNGLYIPSFHGAGVLERFEIIPPREYRLKYTSHEAEIAEVTEEDPVVPSTISKLFNPPVNIVGGRSIGFGIEFGKIVFNNPQANQLFVKYQTFLEVKMTARYKLLELGRSS